jgi:hypothetical protein
VVELALAGQALGHWDDSLHARAARCEA